MLIPTKEFSLPKKLFFRIVVMMYLRKKWWLVVFLYIAIFYELTLDYRLLQIFSALVGIIFPIYLFLFFWRHTNSPKNSIFFKKIFWEIDEEFLNGSLKDGSGNSIKWKNIIKVESKPDYFLLYVSNNQFIYIPHDAFFSEDDKEKMKRLLKAKGFTV